MGVRQKSALGVILAFVATAAVLILLLRRGSDVSPPPGEEVLEPLVESPRPPVQAEAPRATLRGRPSPGPEAVPAGDRAALVRERNDLAREHRQAVERYQTGLATIQDVEQAEMRLFDARHRIGEIDGPAWHRARGVLLARDVERTHLMVEAGMVPPAELERARLSLELERMLTGDADTYAASRDRFLAATKDRNATMVAAGVTSEKTVQEEYERLEAEFPPADVAKARDR